MSANNWAICPKCTKKKIDAVAEVRKLYGTLDVYDYEKRMLKAKAEKAAEPENTLREDYSLGIREGVFQIEYYASCDCGFKFQFEHKEKIK